MSNFPFLILLVGVCIVIIIFIKSILTRMRIPAIVGLILLGMLLRSSDIYLKFLSDEAWEIFKFLANIGIITLLFRIGLESNLRGLIQKLRQASVVWISGVLFSGTLGFLTSYFILEMELIPSLFIAIALTATSVGISVEIWHEAHVLKSPNGELLVDAAELDDISGVILMSLLFSIVPVLRTGQNAALLFVVSKAIGLLLLKLIILSVCCILFSIYLERRITQFFQKLLSTPVPILIVVGIGFIIAALAGLLGFSVAIGAFFAGVVFSRDPESVKIDASFETLYEFFSPFFFIGIGLSIEPNLLTAALLPGGILVVAAILGKVIGHGIPILLMEGWMSAILLGFSMIPRAEIAMIIMQYGLNLGKWAVPPQAFNAMVVVSAATCILSPLIVRSLFIKVKTTPDT